MGVRKFTEEMEFYVLENYQTMCGAEMAAHLGVKKDLITVNMRKLNIQSPKQLLIDYRARNQIKDYTYLHDVIIKKIKTNSIKSLSKELKISSITLSKIVRELGYGYIIENRKLDSRIKPGNIPPNKGKKWDDYLSKESQEKIRKSTHFQKGNKPMNTKELGSIQLGKDGYLKVKVRDSEINAKNYNFESLNRVVYKFFHGELKDNEVVSFKDGNIYNFHPDNLVKKSKYENLVCNQHSVKKICEKYQLKPSKEVEKISQIIINSKILNHESITKSNV